MPEQFSLEMGAIRIFPKGIGERHRGSKTLQLPRDWKPIKAAKYVSRGWYFSNKAGLVEVIRSGILDHEKPFLMIVHMYKGGAWDQATVYRQANVVKAAKSRNLFIFVVQKTDPDEYDSMKNNTAIKSTLPDLLSEAVGDYSRLDYYAEKSLGNALEGRSHKLGPTLRDTLQSIRLDAAIVFGQTYGQCIDSTILGMYEHFREDVYSPGLLDIGIDVVTARDVLIPPQVTTRYDSGYFCFDMGDNIVLDGSPDKPAPRPGVSDNPTALNFPERAPTKYPKDTPTRWRFMH
jgi:nicotinamidase-related amidase